MPTDPIDYVSQTLLAADPDRWLVALWAPRPVRPGLIALFAFEAELWSLPMRLREPLAAEIRLAWWRDAVTALDRAPPPAQPILRALAAHVTPVTGGAALAALEDAPLAKLHSAQDPAAQRADALARLAGAMLGADPPPGTLRLWAQANDLRGKGLDYCGTPPAPPGVPRLLRPLLALDRLGRRDLRRAAAGRTKEPPGTAMRQAIVARSMIVG